MVYSGPSHSWKVHSIVLVISFLPDAAVLSKGVRIQVRYSKLTFQLNNFKMFVAQGHIVLPHSVYTWPHLLSISLTLSLICHPPPLVTTVYDVAYHISGLLVATGP